MAGAHATSTAVTAPVITAVSFDPSFTIARAKDFKADLQAFHKNHFGETCIAYFTSEFLGPVAGIDQEEHYDEEEDDLIDDDGLGYYDDGVKRTLTDEQIAIFRHSEIEGLEREKRHDREKEVNSNGNLQNDGSSEGNHKNESDKEVGIKQDPDDHEKSHIQNVRASLQNSNPNAADLSCDILGHDSTRKRKRPKGQSIEPKPDLRKRTWDVVEQGLDGLDYG